MPRTAVRKTVTKRELHQKGTPFLANEVSKVKPVTLHLPQPHPRQYKFITAFEEHGARFVVGACGTKFGKTFGSSIWLVKEAWQNKYSLNWWVAPTFAQSKMAYATIKRMLPAGSFEEYKADLTIILKEPDGSEHSTIVFKSGDNPDSLRGFAVNSFVLDEAARMPEESFISIMTTVTQTEGRGIIISTPKGRGWFWQCYQRGEKFEDDRETLRFGPDNPDPYPEFYSVRLPTWSNPHVPTTSIKQAKKNLPEDVFRQEFAALFLDDSAGVFRSVNQCVQGIEFQPALPGHRYVMGVDLARLRDYTVITVMDTQTKHIVYMERFNKIAWEVQYHKIIEVSHRYRNPTICMDWTGIGDPIVETLKGAGLSIEPYKIGGSAAKQQLIDKLKVNIENRKISFPRNRVTLALITELKAYEYSFTDSGQIRFEAPSGQHDDCVMSLALCNWVGDVAPFVYRAWQQRGI